MRSEGFVLLMGLSLSGCLGTYTPVGEGTETGATDGGEGGACDPFAQDCDEGSKCMLVDTDEDNRPDTLACSEVNGTFAPGSVCTYDPDGQGDVCDATASCLLYEDWSNEGVCAPFCGPGPDNACPLGDQDCLFDDWGMGHCVRICDPVSADVCGEFFGCYPMTVESGNIRFGCLPLQPDPAGAGAACSRQTDCAAGFACQGANVLPGCDAANCCAAFCQVGDDAFCEGQVTGSVCRDMATAGWPSNDVGGLSGLCTNP